jgi:hypothetical protein
MGLQEENIKIPHRGLFGNSLKQNQCTVQYYPNPEVLSPNIVTFIVKLTSERWARDDLCAKHP